MKTLLLLLLMMPFFAHGAPMLYADEISVNVSDIQCIKCLHKAKVSVNVISGSLGDLQTHAVFKLSGDKGRLGSQSFLKLNKFLWFGGEISTDLALDFDHEIFFALDLNYKHIHLFPYVSLSAKESRIGGLGIKIYALKMLSLGLEYEIVRLKELEEGLIYPNSSTIRRDFSISIGAKVSEESFKKLLSLTGLKIN